MPQLIPDIFDASPEIMARKKRLESSGLHMDFLAKPDPDDRDEGEDDQDERAGMMADILGYVYPEDGLYFYYRDGNPLLYAWNAPDHPRGPNGRFIKKGSAEGYAAAKEKVVEHLKSRGGKVGELLDHLDLLTVKQIHQLKAEFGMSAGAASKEALKKKIAERLHKGRRDINQPEGEFPSYKEWAKGEREKNKAKGDEAEYGRKHGDAEGAGEGGDIPAEAVSEPEPETLDQVYERMKKLSGKEYGEALRALPKEMASAYIKKSNEIDQKRRRQKAAEKGTRTKERRKAQVEKVKEIPGGERMLAAQAKIESMGRMLQAGVDQDDSAWREAQEELQRASLAYRLNSAAIDPDVSDTHKNDMSPSLDGDSGKEATKAIRDGGIPWQVRHFSDDQFRVISGASIGYSTINKDQRVVQLYGTEIGTQDGEGNLRGTLNIHFDAGNPKQSQRARRLIWAIANGKAQNADMDDLRKFIADGVPIPSGDPTDSTPTPSPTGSAGDAAGKEPWEMTREELDKRVGESVNSGERWHRQLPKVPKSQSHLDAQERFDKALEAAEKGNLFYPNSGQIDPNKATTKKAKDIYGEYDAAHRSLKRHEAEYNQTHSAERHKQVIQAALAAGKPVPPEVLADYKDLAPPVAPESAQNPPKRSGG